MKTNMKKTCEGCGFLLDTRINHQCDKDVMEDKERQKEKEFEQWRRNEMVNLEADEMLISDF